MAWQSASKASQVKMERVLEEDALGSIVLAPTTAAPTSVLTKPSARSDCLLRRSAMVVVWVKVRGRLESGYQRGVSPLSSVSLESPHEDEGNTLLARVTSRALFLCLVFSVLSCPFFAQHDDECCGQHLASCGPLVVFEVPLDDVGQIIVEFEAAKHQRKGKGKGNAVHLAVVREQQGGL